jgi:hypothetical protein
VYDGESPSKLAPTHFEKASKRSFIFVMEGICAIALLVFMVLKEGKIRSGCKEGMKFVRKIKMAGIEGRQQKVTRGG